MLDDEMPIEQDGFDVSQQGVIAIEIGPARLHHADVVSAVRRQKIRNRAPQKIGVGKKIGVEDSYELPVRGLQPVFESPSLIALAIGAVNVRNRHALRGMSFDAVAGDFTGLVGGIIEHLHIEQFARIVEARHRVHQSLDYVALVVDGKLYGNFGPLDDSGRRAGDILAILEIRVRDAPLLLGVRVFQESPECPRPAAR